ncbi:MAG TPA: hypothetical protein VHG91_08025 [Longimicrobium sp.]|nr:hypothetical protein [Longimicrobium sp.]
MNLADLASNPLVVLLAFVGGAALVHRLFRTLLRAGLATAEATAVEGLLEVSVRRGDLTGMAERRARVRDVRRLRGRALLLAGLWVGLLAVPPALGVAGVVYAASSVLWLLPRAPLRLPAPEPEAETEP